MLRLHDVVKLKEDNKRIGILSSNLGSIIDILQDGEAYVVEFINDDGETIESSLFTEFTEDELILVESSL